MKKLLLALSFFATVAQAADVQIVNIGAATSPTALYAQAYSKNLTIGNQFVPAKSCRDAMAIAGDSVFLVANDIYLQARRLGQECSPPMRAENILAMSDGYFEVCRKKGSAKTLRDPGVIVGRASVHPIREWASDFNKRNKTTVKGVGFSGSKSVLAAVLNGDADWGVIAREIAVPAVKEGIIECPYNTEAASARSLHREFSMINDEYVLKYMLVANTKDPKILAALKKTAQDPRFRQYLEASMHSNITLQPTQKNVDQFLSSVSDLNRLLDSYRE